MQLTDAITSEGKDLSSINDPIGKFLWGINEALSYRIVEFVFGFGAKIF